MQQRAVDLAQLVHQVRGNVLQGKHLVRRTVLDGLARHVLDPVGAGRGLLVSAWRLPPSTHTARALDAHAAITTLDEANSTLGLARAAADAELTRTLLLRAQRDLYHMMAELASTQQAAPQFRKIDAARVAWLETETDAVTAMVTLPREFVVPGDSLPGAYLDLARTTTRRQAPQAKGR